MPLRAATVALFLFWHFHLRWRMGLSDSLDSGRESEGCSEHNSSGRNSFHRRRQSLITAGLGDEEEPTHCVVLRSGGLLSVLDMERGSEVRAAGDGGWRGALLGQRRLKE